MARAKSKLTQARLKKAELTLETQKKAPALLGTPLNQPESADDE